MKLTAKEVNHMRVVTKQILEGTKYSFFGNLKPRYHPSPVEVEAALQTYIIAGISLQDLINTASET